MKKENLVEKNDNKDSENKNVEVKKDNKNKKKLFIIIGLISLIVISFLVWFFFFKYSNKTITFYRYENKLFLSNISYFNDVDREKLEKYKYRCKSEKCAVITNSSIGVDLDENWVIIDDSNKATYLDGDGSSNVRRNDKYLLYNVVTGKKMKVSLKKNRVIHDILKDENENPVGLIVSLHNSKSIIDISTGKNIMDISDIVYGSTLKNARDLRVVNNGVKDLYLFSSENYSNKLLYDKDLNYIDDILSEDYFDDEGNIIKIRYDEKTSKTYFKVFDLNNNLLRTSKMYDQVLINNGYLIVQLGDVINIIDSRENKMIEVSKSGKKFEYTTYNDFYKNDEAVSVFEIEETNNGKKATHYFYNLVSKQLEKNNIDFDGYEGPYHALSRYYNKGYTKYKVNNVNVYLDNSFDDEKQKNLKNTIDQLSKNKISKKLFTTKQNLYLFTTYNYQLLKKSDNYSYYSLNIVIDDETQIGNIIKQLAVNFHNKNYTKLNNDAFKKLYDNYYSFFDDGIHSSGVTYGDSGFFGIIMSSYFIKESVGFPTSTWQDNDVEFTRQRIKEKGNIEEFDNLVKKYVESYVIK